MADVEMKEATAGASSKGKAVAKGSDAANDGKKKFEVKKVPQQPWEPNLGQITYIYCSGMPWLSGPGILLLITVLSVGTISWTCVCSGLSPIANGV